MKTDKTISIMQPYFFPYIGYFQLIYNADIFLIYGNVTFRKSSYITRNTLMQSMTKKQYLIQCPVLNSSSNQLIKNMKIDETSGWREYLVKKLQHDYIKKPFYEETIVLISKLLKYKDGNLINFHTYCIKEISKHLGIITEIILDDERFINIENNLSTIEFKSSILNYKIKRIIDICKYMKCNQYVNSEGGMMLYDVDLFKKNDIDLIFLKSKSSNYSPDNLVHNQNLSIIDLLMNMGKDEIFKMLSMFDLIKNNKRECI